MSEVAARRSSGSLGRRMILIAAGWISVLLDRGGLALACVLINAVTSHYDSALD